VMHNDVTQWHHAFAYRLSRARHTTPASGEEGAPGEEMLTPAFLPVTRTKPAEFRSR
jgi:hypothetical protein